jgi:hypothetical protein
MNHNPFMKENEASPEVLDWDAQDGAGDQTGDYEYYDE